MTDNTYETESLHEVKADKTMEHVPIPDDEPSQIVCTGEEPGDDVWQPAFGTWEADDFGLDSDEPVSRGERLFVNRRLFDALFAKCDALEAENQRLREENQSQRVQITRYSAEQQQLFGKSKPLVPRRQMRADELSQVIAPKGDSHDQ